VNDALKLSKPIKAALETTHEVTKLIKYSPHCEGIFHELKSAYDITTGYQLPGVRVLCPTRWTVNADSLASIIGNYAVLQSTWEEAVEAVREGFVGCSEKSAESSWPGFAASVGDACNQRNIRKVV